MSEATITVVPAERKVLFEERTIVLSEEVVETPTQVTVDLPAQKIHVTVKAPTPPDVLVEAAEVEVTVPEPDLPRVIVRSAGPDVELVSAPSLDLDPGAVDWLVGKLSKLLSRGGVSKRVLRDKHGNITGIEEVD